MEKRGPITADMVLNADRIKWETTGSVLEALILEANLIKKYQPYYNIKEKDDKSFNYVCITNEQLPKVVVVRGKELLGVKSFKYKATFGPYPNGLQLREALKIIRRIFPFLDDQSKNYLEFYRQINLVPDLKDRKLYLQNIKNIKLFFTGKKKQIFRNLKKEMNEYAKRREFERAGEIKRQIFALKHINDVALIRDTDFIKNSFSSGPRISGAPTPARPFGRAVFNFAIRIEAYDVAHLGGKNMVGVMVVVENGEAQKSGYRKFSARVGSAFGGKTILNSGKANDIAALTEVLERRLAHAEWPYPGLIVVDGGTAQLNAARKSVSRLNLDIPVVSVVKDERHRPKNIMGDISPIPEYRSAILLANSEAHRFAIAYHKNMRGKSFLK